MEPELSIIFRVKIVAKNVVLGSQGAQHQAAYVVSCFFLKKHTNVVAQSVRF